MFSSIVFFALFSVAFGQQVGTLEPEVHPKLPSQRCTAAGCTTLDTSIVLDANWRWLHSAAPGSFQNCYTGNAFNTALCPNGVDCARNCALEGAKYTETYGISTSGNALTLKFVTGANVGSRVYLMEAGSDSKYQLFKLKNQEFTFDVDMSNLPCGINGALYMSEMAADGGASKFPNNKAGAKYGTGYCDAQCPHDLKFIDGEANTIGWSGSPSDPNSGTGKYGACCSEMDLWEANRAAAAFTPHSCTLTGRCEGLQCGDGADRYKGVCDKDGCDFNSYRQGNQTFLGQDKIVNTNKKMTVVTQFITNTGTATGALSEIRRIYIQDGRVIQNSVNTIPGIPRVNSITDNFCSAQKTVFEDTNDFAAKGGMAAMGRAYENGMVLALSIWDDHAANLLWLDSQYPLNKDPSLPGVSRGPCPRTSGVPAEVEAQFPNASVTFSNIKFGDLGTTFSGGSQPPVNPPVNPPVSSTRAPVTSTTTTPTTPTGTPGGASQWQQCGGRNHAGPSGCVAPFRCVVLNEYYSQCQ